MTRRKVHSLLLMFICSVVCPARAGAQDSTACAHVVLEHEAPQGLDLSQETRALFVFARFPDETQNESCSPDPWPASATLVPAWAEMLLDDTTDPQEMTEGSLTHFYWLMSGGEHLLTGAVWDSVVVLDSIKTYRAMGGAPLVHANADLISRLDALPDSVLDWDDYDGNGDHVIDFVFLCYRQVYSANGGMISSGITGESSLNVAASTTVTSDSATYTIASPNGAQVYPVLHKRGPVQTRGLAIHEYG